MMKITSAIEHQTHLTRTNPEDLTIGDNDGGDWQLKEKNKDPPNSTVVSCWLFPLTPRRRRRIREELFFLRGSGLKSEHCRRESGCERGWALAPLQYPAH